MEKKNQRNYVIVALVCAIMIMAVGYAALAQTLTINGTAAISSTWNVAITGISEGTPTGTATNKTPAAYTGTSATFDVDLKSPGDKMVFDITVSNTGTLDAELTGLTVTPATTATSGIYYKVTGVTVNTTTLAAGATNTVTVEVGWNTADTAMPEVKTVPLTVSMTYTQQS
ncbi:MAG: hypothetical protein KH135_03600 [Firmicutes bacterium]|nr:hypothetical protein [Bacillota bacterium]